MNTPDESADERRLREALHRAADQVSPSPDGLAQIRRRLHRPVWWRSPAVIGVAVATAAGVGVIAGAITLFGEDDSPVVVSSPGPPDESEPAPGPTTTPSGQPSEPSEPSGPGEPTGAPVVRLTLPVYFTAGHEDGPRLVREFQSVETASPPVRAAVEQMLADSAVDPDYDSLWPAGIGVTSAEVSDGIIAVDLDAAPTLPDASARTAELAVQQLVYTASAAAASLVEGVEGALPVRITVGGEPVDELFGVDVSEPVSRADPLEVRQLVQINEPNEGATATSPVTVSGEAAAFEATVQWTVLQGGNVVEEGFTTAEQCCTFAPFSFDVELSPGTYQMVVTESDPSGGEGRAPFADSKTVTVR